MSYTDHISHTDHMIRMNPETAQPPVAVINEEHEAHLGGKSGKDQWRHP